MASPTDHPDPNHDLQQNLDKLKSFTFGNPATPTFPESHSPTATTSNHHRTGSFTRFISSPVLISQSSTFEDLAFINTPRQHNSVSSSLADPAPPRPAPAPPISLHANLSRQNSVSRPLPPSTSNRDSLPDRSKTNSVATANSSNSSFTVMTTLSASSSSSSSSTATSTAHLPPIAPEGTSIKPQQHLPTLPSFSSDSPALHHPPPSSFLPHLPTTRNGLPPNIAPPQLPANTTADTASTLSFATNPTADTPASTTPTRQQSLVGPSAFPDELTFISYLDLSTNQTALDEIASTGRLPKWVQKCSNLQFLVAEGLGLTNIDEWVSESLLQLRVLRVSNNQIKTWPDHLARLLPHDQITVIEMEGNPCFMAFCERYPRFATEYAKAAGYLSSRKALLRSNKKAARLAASGTGAANGLSRDSVISMSSATPASMASKKKSSFFFGKSRRKKEQTVYEDSVLAHDSNSQGSSGQPSSKTSSTYNGAYYSDDSSDDEMLTSLEPVIPHLIKKPSTGSVADRSRSVSSMNSRDTIGGIGNTLNSGGPDKWAHHRIERTEIEKTKVLLNLLRDIWELSTRNIIVMDPTLSAAATFQRSLSMSTSSSPTHARNSLSALSPRTSHSGSSITGINPFSQLRDNNGAVSSLGLGRSASSSAKLKSTIHTHSRLNSLDVLEHYLDEESIDVEMPKISPPDRTQIISMLTKSIEDEKNYVLRMGELMSIYVKSKKRPPKAARLLASIPPLYQLHSSVMLGALQRCLDGYVTRTDPNLGRLAELISAHLNEFHVYVDYEITVEESMRLINFWKRITAIETNQPSMHGTSLPQLGSYRNPDAYIAEWIQSCLHNKAHKLNGIADYLQLPIDQLQRYRMLLRRLSTITPELESAYKSFEEICVEIEQEKPKIAQQRRMSEFDQIYSMGSLMARNSNMPARKYLGDAVVLLKSEIHLELPSKNFKTPDAIHYMNDSISATDISAPNTTSTPNTIHRSNPVPKVVTRTVHRTKFTLPLFRLIVCDDVVILTDEDKKKVVKVLSRRQVSATLPWKYPIRDGDDALPTGDLVSVKSRSSTGSTSVPIPGSGGNSNIGNTGTGISPTKTSSAASQAGVPVSSSSSIRLVFHDEPMVWYCMLRSFTGGKRGTSKEPRARLVDLFEI